MLDGAQDFIADYWPWLLGGTIGLWLMLKMSGASGNSGGGVITYGPSPETAAIAAQSADNQFLAQVQREIGLGQLAVESNRDLLAAEVAVYEIDASRDVALAGYEAETIQQSIQTQGQVTIAGYQSQAAVLAAQVAAGVQAIYAQAELVTALNQPTITAINASAAQNIAAIGAITDIGKTVYAGKVNLATSSNELVSGMVNTAGYFGTQMTGKIAPAIYSSQNVQNVTRPDTSRIGDIAKVIGAIA